MLGDKLKNVMHLWGHPACPDTAKCLMTAAEKGIDIKTELVDVKSGGADTPEYRLLSPFGSVPCLKDADFVVYGTRAIMSYLDDKGFGPSLVPRNGVVRAMAYQWSHIACDYVGPQIAALMSGDGGDRAAIEKAFDALDAQLQSKSTFRRGDYIAGDFFLVDIHWAAYANALFLANAGDIVESRGAVKDWWGRIKTHPSTSKEKILAYNVLPTTQDVESNTLRDIHINV